MGRQTKSKWIKSGSGSRQYRVSGGRRRILCVRGSKNGPWNLMREEPALWGPEGEHSRQTWGAGRTRPVQRGIVERAGECERRAQRQAGPFLLSYYRQLHGVWIVSKWSNKPLEFQTREDMIWILFFKVIVTVCAEWSVLGKSGSDLGNGREEETWMD